MMLTDTLLAQFKVVLRSVKPFAKISDEELEQLAGRVKPVPIKPAQVIFAEGEVGHCLYVIVEGAAQVLTTGPEGHPIILAHLQAGDFFGAQSLLPGSAGTRSATLIATAKGLLLEVSAEDFAAIVNRDADLLSELQHWGKGLSRHKQISRTALFQHLPLGQEMVGWLVEKTFQPGEVIYQPGDSVDQFYLIMSGIARVVQVADGKTTVQRLGAGSFFGEQYLLQAQTGCLTVTAEQTLQVLGLPGAQFLALYAQNPALREQMEHLRGLYHLPGEGVVTLHSGRLMDCDSLTALYHYPNGMTITATKVLGKPIFSMSRGQPDPEQCEAMYYEEGASYRELLLLNHRLVGVTVVGEWPDLGRVHRQISQGKRLFPWQRALFRVQGELWLHPERESFAENAIVCQCMGVQRKTLNEALLKGCDSVEKLAEATGASKVCGACIPALERLLGRLDNLQPVQLMAIVEVATDIKAFRFKPVRVAVQPSLPGQHIRVEAHIDGRWIQRIYTLTSPANQQDYYEITVKREPYGIFSTWLHTQANMNSLLRVSQPSGQFYPQPGQTVVYFAGGIGITPAIALYRSLPPESGQIYIDYSVVTPDQIVYQQELAQTPTRVHFRVTQGHHFIQADEVCALVKQYPHAEFYVCGPSTYEAAVCRYLQQCAVPVTQVRVEHFSSFTDATTASSNVRHAGVILLLSSVIMLLLGLFLLNPVPYTTLLHDPAWKQVTGFILLGFNIFSMVIGLRKASLLELGYFKSWRFAHVLNGLILIGLVSLHTGTYTGAGFNQLFLFVYLAILGTGALVGILFFGQQRYHSVALHLAYQAVKWGHFGLLWLFPPFVLLHILTVYYF